jgi:hypothetical protein
MVPQHLNDVAELNDPKLLDYLTKTALKHGKSRYTRCWGAKVRARVRVRVRVGGRDKG